MRYTPINCRSFGYIISTHAEYLRARLLVVVPSLSRVQLFACQASLSSTVSQSLFRCISIELVMLSNHLIPCCALLLCFQSFLASQSFPVNWLFASGDQSVGVSVLATVLPRNIQGWFPLGSTGLISLLSKGLSRAFSSPTIQKHLFFITQPSLWSNSQICTWLLENRSFDYMDLCRQSGVFAV